MCQLIQQIFPEQPILQAQNDMNKLYDWIDNGTIRAEKCLKIINQFNNSQTNDVISVISRDQQIQIIYPIQIQIFQDVMSFADEILQGATQIVNQAQVTIRDRFDGYCGPIRCDAINLQLLSLLSNYKPLRIELLKLKNLLYFNDKPLVINISNEMTQNIELLASLSVCSGSNCSLQYFQCNKQIKSSEISQMCWIIQNSYRTFTMINPEQLQNSAQFWLLNCYPVRHEIDLQKDEIYQGYQQIKDEVSDSQCININGQLILICRRQQQDCQCKCCCKNIFCDKEQKIQIKESNNQLSILDFITKNDIHADLDCVLGACRFGCDDEQEYVKLLDNINRQTQNLLQTLLKLSHLQFHLIQIKKPTNQLLVDQAMIEGDCSMQITENIKISGFYLTLHDANEYTTCLYYDDNIKTPLELFYFTYINKNLTNSHLRVAVIDQLYTFFMNKKIISPTTQINELPIPIDLQLPLVTLFITTNPSLCYETNNIVELLKNPMQPIDLQNQQTIQIIKKLKDLIPFKDNDELNKFINIYFFITQGINMFLKAKQTKTSKIMTQMLMELCESIKQQDFSIIKYSISLSNLYKFFDKSLLTKDNCNVDGKLGKQFIYSLKNLDVFNYLFNQQQTDQFDIYKIFNIQFKEELETIDIHNIVYQIITKGLYKLLANNISTKMSSQKQPCIYNITEKRMYPLKQGANATEILTSACAQISEQYWCYCQPQNLYFINTIDQTILNNQQFLEQTQQLQNCLYIFLPDIVSLIHDNKHQQQSRLNDLQSQILSLVNQTQNWWNSQEYQEIIQYQQQIQQDIDKQVKILDCEQLIQQIENIFTLYSGVQTYASQQICELLKQQYQNNIHIKQIRFILKMTVIYVQCASAFILVGLSQQKKEEMIAEILDSYFELLNYLFNNQHQQLVNVTNSIILTHIIQQDQLKQIFDQKALSFIEIEQLQMLQYNEFSTAILAAILTIWLGYTPIWQTLEEIDFFTLLFICKTKKYVKNSFLSQKQPQSIEHQIYYGELFQDYQYLLPKNNSAQQVTLGCLSSNIVLTKEQFEQIQQQMTDNEILMQKVNFEEIQKTVLQENYEQFKDQPICLNLLSSKFLSDNKIITSDDLYYIQQDQGEEFYNKLIYISQHISSNITVADYYQILYIIWKGQQNKIQISSRYQSLIQQIKAQTILQLVKQYKQKLQRNVTWADVIDNTIQQHNNNDIVIKIILKLLNQDVHHINIYKQYQIEDLEQQLQVLSQEEVYQALNCMIDNLLKEKLIDYQDMIKIINYGQSFRYQQLNNQYSRISVGNKIKFMLIKQDEDITLPQIQEDLSLQLNQQDQWFAIQKFQQNEQYENIIFSIQKDFVQYEDLQNIISQIQITNYKKILIILYIKDIQLTTEEKLNLIQKCDIYNVNKPEINLSKIQTKEQENQIIFWQDTDYKQWRILQMTTQNVFAEEQQQKFRYSKLNSSMNQSGINQIQKDQLVQKIQQLSLQGNNIEEKLTKLFTLPFINFYQQVITQSSQLEPQQFEKAVEQYSGTQYLLSNDIYNLQKITQLNQDQSKQLTYKWLEYSYLLVYYPEFQQQLPQVQGHIHKWLTAYYNNIQRTPQQQKKKLDQNKQFITIQDTLQMPHLFPDTTIAMSLSLILSQLQNTNSLWNDLQQSLEQQYQPTDDQFFKVFLFIYSNIGKISQASILTQFVIQSQDPQFEKQKFFMFTDMYLNILTKQINKQKQIQQNMAQQISQIEYLIFYFNNTKLCNLISQTIHNMYKSDLQHYVVKYLMEQAEQQTPEQFYNNLSQHLLSFASDCFEKNLSYCVFFIRFALLHCSKEQIKQEKTKYWLTLTYYYLCYQNSQEAELKQMCQVQKDMRLINIFKSLINKQVQSVILDILAVPQIQQNKYVIQQILKHYFLLEDFNDNEDIAVRELIFCFEQYNVDHQLIVQLFQQKHNRIEIIDTESMINVQILKQLKINSMNLVNSILQLYKQKLDSEFENKIKQASQQEQLQFIKTQLSLRTKKWQFNYDLQQLNSYQPRGSEYINDISIIKQCNTFTEQLIGYYLAKLFTETKFDFLQLKPLIKLNDQIQYQFYAALQSLYSRDIVNTIIQRNEVIQQIFPQIYSTAKQASLNAECDKLPQFSICHYFNSKLYYEQRVNKQWTQLTQLSQLMQEYTINNQKQEIPDPIKKILQSQNNQIYNHKNLQRIQIIKDVYLNENVQPMIKSTLIATEQLLLEPGVASNFYQLLADNHDECLGLYCPGHGFESRLGIVHFDCGTKDSKYVKMSPLEVQVRALSSIATRLTWILSYACIYLSLKSNPVTMTTSKEKSIMSEPDLLEMPRDDYCFVVIENCFSVITQILCCYQYEALVLYQQFIINFIKLIKQTDKNTNIYMLRSAQQRDKLEDIIQQATDMAMVSQQEILKKNQQTTQIQVNQVAVQQVQHKQLTHDELVTKLLKAKIPINVQTHLANGVFNGIIISKILHYHINKLQPTMTLQECISVCEEISKVKSKFYQFIEDYNLSKHLLTIGNGCQDNTLPDISNDVCIGQLITFKADDVSQNLQDFAVMDQYIQAGKQYLQTLQLPYLPIYDELECIEVTQQSWLLI